MKTTRVHGTKKFAILSALSLLFAGISLAVTAPEASAETCTHPSWSSHGNVPVYKNPGKATVEMHTGPEASCAVVENITSNSRELYDDCWIINSVGNYWDHVRDPKNGDQGWIYEVYLASGTFSAC
jgi:hypothetical protein